MVTQLRRGGCHCSEVLLTIYRVILIYQQHFGALITLPEMEKWFPERENVRNVGSSYCLTESLHHHDHCTLMECLQNAQPFPTGNKSCLLLTFCQS